MPPRYLLRRCYRSLSPTPLRGSRGQQPRGAAVSAAMIAPCADEVLRAAVVARKPVFMRFRRGGGMVARVGANLLHIAPTHPAARRCGSLTLPHRRSAPRKPASRQKRHRRTSPPQRRRTNAAGTSQGSIERIGALRPLAPHRSPRQAFGGRQELSLIRREVLVGGG